MTDIAQPDSNRQAWRYTVTALLVSLSLLFVAYWDTMVSIAAIWWRSETYAHGLLIVPIVAYMVWTRRDTLKREVPAPDWLGLVLLVLLTVAWVVADTANVLFGKQLAVVATVPALLWALAGRHVLWAVAFPVAYLFFAVPVGESLVPPLQDITAVFTVKALQLTGIPVYWEGRFISIPKGNFEVAEACSGVRYLIASVALGCLYAYLSYRSYWRRLVFIGLATLVPVLANGLRAYGIVMLAHLSDMRLAIGVDHLIYGWIFFGVVMFLLFWLGTLWREPATEPGSEQAAESAHAGLFRPGALLGSTAAVALLLFSGPGAQHWRDIQAGGDPGSRQVALVHGSSGWAGPQNTTDTWVPRFLGADAVARQVYRKGGQSVWVYVAYYAHERQGAELVNSQNVIYDGKIWRRVGEQTRDVLLPNGATRAVHETRMRSGGRSRVVWHWYDVGGYSTANPVFAKLLRGWNGLVAPARGSAVVAVGADYGDDVEQGRAHLKQFLSDVGPTLFNSRATSAVATSSSVAP